MKDDYISSGRTRQKLETRNRILKHAQDLMARGTVFNLEEVAHEAGMSRATVYRYFSSIDLLIAEAGLYIKTRSPEEILKGLSGKNTRERILGIQKYYNKLSLDNEEAFRKYVGIVLTQKSKKFKRGARRVKTLEMALSDNNSVLNEQELTLLINAATVLMGIEAMIVTRDVCGLSKQESTQTLRWALEKIVDACLAEN